MQPEQKQPITRREFIRDTAAAAGLAIGLSVLKPRTVLAAPADKPAIEKTRSYNPGMEYRRLGQTGLWVSAVCLGGHWKRIDKVIAAKGAISPYTAPMNAGDMDAFLKNRDEVVSRCMEVGINTIDFAGDSEAEVYCKVLGKRREQMFLAYSHPASELREPPNRTCKKLLELFEAGLKRCNLEYADIWRLMCLERGGEHSAAETDEMLQALETAKKQGKCRFTGISTHDRDWAQALIEKHPNLLQVLVFPYTARSKALPEHSLFDTIKKYDIGTLGIKPFASNAIFKGDGSPASPMAEEDCRIARLTIRFILNNPQMTAPIPGLISKQQVDNMAQAVKERRELDAGEKAELDKANDEMYARLPADYQWLKQWEYV